MSVLATLFVLYNLQPAPVDSRIIAIPI